MRITRDMHQILNQIKGFDTVGRDGSNPEYLYIRYDGKPYAVRVVEMKEERVTDADMKKHYNLDADGVQNIVNFKAIKRYL